MKKIVATLFALLLCVSINVSASFTISLSPEKPKPLDTITFTVRNTSGVLPYHDSILVIECNEKTGVCYTIHNVTLTSGKSTVELTHADATYISYRFGYFTEHNQWIELPPTKLTLSLSTVTKNGTDINQYLILVAITIVGAAVLFIAYIALKNYLKRKEGE